MGSSWTHTDGFITTGAGTLAQINVNAGTTMTVVAGTFDSCGSTGIDGGTPTSQELDSPRAAVPTPDGGFLVSDTSNCVIRKVNSAGTTMTRVAGIVGTCGNNGDGRCDEFTTIHSGNLPRWRALGSLCPRPVAVAACAAPDASRSVGRRQSWRRAPAGLPAPH